VGDYVNDAKHGQGTFTWPTGQTYNGSWENGVQHGNGYYTNKNGIMKQGRWEKGKRVEWINDTTEKGRTQD
jgi:hypothetical protein